MISTTEIAIRVEWQNRFARAISDGLSRRDAFRKCGKIYGLDAVDHARLMAATNPAIVETDYQVRWDAELERCLQATR